ncbi:MAG: hypothetical protein HY700_12545, partial [Gemmatimonadetes bacterium]|nr:hypothetical protein [Gemmatimonadota bacterium]
MENDVCALAFCSTSGTEAQFGATHFLLNPHRTTYNRTGFTAATYIYPSRLIAQDANDLGPIVGKVIDEMPQIRDRLREALGLWTGTTDTPGEAAGSWRGRVVEFSNEIEAALETKFGLIVTEPRYSIEQRFQLVLPVWDADDIEPDELDVSLTGLPALPFKSPMAAVSFVQSVFHPGQIAGDTTLVVNAAAMNEIDRNLEYNFG